MFCASPAVISVAVPSHLSQIGMLWLKKFLKGPPAGVVDPPDKNSGDHNLDKLTGRAEKRKLQRPSLCTNIYIYIHPLHPECAGGLHSNNHLTDWTASRYPFMIRAQKLHCP